MAIVIFRKDNGEEFEIRSNLHDEFDFSHDVLFRSDYIATKLITTEDIECALDDEDFEPSEENVLAVLEHLSVYSLENCEREIEMIYDAIFDANHWDGLEKLKEEKFHENI